MILEVKDQVLPEASFREVQDFCEGDLFQTTSPGAESPVWRNNAPHNPLVGSTLLWSLAGQYPQGLRPDQRMLLYPSGMALDAVIAAAWTIAKAHIPGAEQECVGVTATVFRYQAGSRLIWHKDQASLGAFTLYVSDWSENNGGQFAFKHPNSRHGQFIDPIPNRIVVFASGLDHAVFPVAADAGNARVSISGFFIDQARANALLTGYAATAGLNLH